MIKVGQVFTTKKNEKIKVIEYINSNKIIVMFLNSNYIKTTRSSEIYSGQLISPYTPTLVGKFYIGEGKYEPYVNKKRTKIYKIYKSMINRCYLSTSNTKYNTYEDASISEDWYNFQNFAKWYDENYYIVNEEQMNIDKDILIKGNKIYSPNNCIFVPKTINLLFTNRKNERGDLPVGVCFDKKRGLFISQCTLGNGFQKYLGSFTSAEDAFNVYKINKENYIKEVADRYKDKIPIKLYNAMYNYEISITD